MYFARVANLETEKYDMEREVQLREHRVRLCTMCKIKKEFSKM